jgi:mono/diheme cytochrome c family protein
MRAGICGIESSGKQSPSAAPREEERMSSRKRFALASLFCATLASAAVYAEFNAGYYTPTELGSIRQTLPYAASAGASYDVGAYALYPASLASGDGEQEVKAYCNTCHSPRYIAMQPPLPADVWAAEVNKMMKSYGASIPQDAAQKITAYLQSHYTPETRKK